MTNHVQKAKAVFLEAIHSVPAEEWSDFVDHACAGDPELRMDVNELLQEHASGGQLVTQAVQAVAARVQPAAGERPGAMIGPYKLLEQIGEGGMGVVYVAEQTEPVRRRVALKIIKPGMDTKQVIARFEAERQALALMDHPNIARVLDAGTTGEGIGSRESGLGAGRPYFVMELVRGLPITEYCDKARLTPRQRLALFAEVCQAVQHAHLKGVIHRDLKPSNVMITVHDGRPVAKVIDFGVAKAIGQQLTERTVYTAHAQLVGTPLYMSPEQADLASSDVDTRSDVYSLGVLLYELLTGETPFDKERLHNAGFDEMRRIIREDEPPRPSHRVSTLGAAASSTISQQRGLDERHLDRILRGELDWIVMKALEKDRSRRYESASALAADIQRYLSDEPVLACPPTTMYRFQKFARKYKPALVTAGAIAACLILGTTVSAWQAVRATEAEAQAKQATAAEAQQRQRAEVNEQKANTQRDEAERQRDEVKELNNKLQATQSELRSTLYAAHMNLAKHAWDESAISRMHQLLRQQLPKAGEQDLRGFEWHYLNRVSRANLLLTLEGHESAIAFIGYTPDGKRLVTATWQSRSNSGKVAEPDLIVWDAQSGKQLFQLRDQGVSYYSVVLSPDGTRLGTRTSDSTAKVWDTETGKELLTIQGVVGDVAYSPDGKHLAGPSMTKDAEGKVLARELKIWDAATGQELRKLTGAPPRSWEIAYSPDGMRLATEAVGGRDMQGKRLPGDVKVWDVTSGRELLNLKSGTTSIWKLSFSPDGKRLAGSNIVWDSETGKEVLAFADEWNGFAMHAFSPDGKLVAAPAGRSSAARIKVWNAENGAELFNLARDTTNVNNVAFSPDSKRLASAADDRTLRVWDLQSGQEIKSLKGSINTDFNYVTFSPDGSRLVSGTWTGAVNVWDVRKGEATLKLPGSRFAFDADLKRVASVAADNTVTVWEAQTGRETISFKGHTKNVRHVAFSPDGSRVASVERAGRSFSVREDQPVPVVIKVWDAQTGKEFLSLQAQTNDSVFANAKVAFSPDGKRLACATGIEGKVWEVHTGDEIFLFKPEGDSVAFGPDGKRLASASFSGTVRVWDVLTGQETLTLKGSPDLEYACVTFGPDGKSVAAAGGRDVNIWDAESGQELHTLMGHGSRITSLAYTSDGKRLTSSSTDGAIKVWDARTGQELLSLMGPERRGSSIAFSSNGHRLASASGDGTVMIFDATPLPEKP